MSIDFTVGQKVRVTIVPKDQNGGTGYVDQPPTWVASELGVVELTISADGLTCDLRALAQGNCEVTPHGVADGNAIAGLPITVNVEPAPLLPAVTFEEIIGPITQLAFGKP